MNASLCFVYPLMSFDATRLKSSYRENMYLATVKTGLYEIYAVAIPIGHVNEGLYGWNMLLTHLKNACSLLDMDHLLQGHSQCTCILYLLFPIKIKV
jgi:hypothetical protein